MKTDISITKSLTINTGNYESVRPSITITLKDVDSTKFKTNTVAMSTLTEDLLRVEIIKSSTIFEEMRKEGGYTSYVQTLLDQIDEISERIDTQLGIIGTE